jgi:hypothetical protein
MKCRVDNKSFVAVTTCGKSMYQFVSLGVVSTKGDGSSLFGPITIIEYI